MSLLQCYSPLWSNSISLLNRLIPHRPMCNSSILRRTTHSSGSEWCRDLERLTRVPKFKDVMPWKGHRRVDNIRFWPIRQVSREIKFGLVEITKENGRCKKFGIRSTHPAVPFFFLILLNLTWRSEYHRASTGTHFNDVHIFAHAKSTYITLYPSSQCPKAIVSSSDPLAWHR